MLSYHSLQKAGATKEQAFTYGTVTLFADLINVVRLGLIIEKATIIYVPIWISDVFDVNQSLRVLSNVGLLTSIFVIYKLLPKKFWEISAVHIGLYITKNPLCHHLYKLFRNFP